MALTTSQLTMLADYAKRWKNDNYVYPALFRRDIVNIRNLYAAVFPDKETFMSTCSGCAISALKELAAYYNGLGGTTEPDTSTAEVAADNAEEVSDEAAAQARAEANKARLAKARAAKAAKKAAETTNTTDNAE